VETTADPKKVRWELENAIRDGLSDAPRSGSPGKFTAHDYCQIMGVSLEDPNLSGRPISHWGLTELTQEVIKRGIVNSISRSQVGSFLKMQ
jgi:putative transposase